MTHTTTHEKALEVCDSKGLSSETTDANFSQTDEHGEAFSPLAALFVQADHILQRTDAKDGSLTYWAARWGPVCYRPTSDAARRFLDQIGGRL